MENEILSILKFIMILAGMWHITKENTLKYRIYKIYSVFMQCYFHLFMAVLLINALMKWRCTELFLEMISYDIVHINSAIMGLFAKREKMKKVFSWIYNYEQVSYPKEGKSSRNIYNYYSTFNVHLSKFLFITMILICCGAWYAITIHITIIGGSEECPLRKGVLYQVWYPFHTKYNYWLSILFDLTMCYIGILMHIHSKICTVTLVIFGLTQIKILSNMLRNIDKNATRLKQLYNISNQKSIEIIINKCILRHQEVNSLMGRLQSATKEMMLFFSSAALLRWQANSKYHLIRGCLFFPADLLHIFVFFWFANEVYVESMEIATIIYYELNWLNYSKEIRRNLIIMMMRSQTPLQFRAIGFGEMTLVQYKNILKSCYSMVTFFKTVYDE